MTQFPEGDMSAALGTLQSLTDEQLQKFLDDEDTFNTYVNQLPQVQKWESDKEMQVASNKSLAEYNLSLEPKLKDGKASLWELYEKARSLVDEVETKRAQLESLNSRTSLDTTYALLQASSAEAEEKSEELSESFLNGTIDLETFTNQFIPQRVTAHLRKLKTDKMAEIVNSSRSRSFSAPYPTLPPTMMMPMPNSSPVLPM